MPRDLSSMCTQFPDLCKHLQAEEKAVEEWMDGWRYDGWMDRKIDLTASKEKRTCVSIHRKVP